MYLVTLAAPSPPMLPHQHRRLRAPAADGAALIDPPLDQIPALVDRNRAVASRFESASGFSNALRHQARARLIDPPRICVEAVEVDTDRAIIATGHQPELFHPGVWFKNFLTDAIARRIGAWAINLRIDNDLARASGIRVPTQANGTIQIREVPFDAPAPATTWESRHIIEPETFREFGSEVRRALQPWLTRADFSSGTLLDRFWPHAVASFSRQNSEFGDFASTLSELVDEMQPQGYSPFGMVAECFAEARSRIEADLGLTLLDCPLCEVVRLQPFLEFTRILLSRYREFHDVHNSALAEYRSTNRIRSHAHPVPELARADDWLEVPLWMHGYQSLEGQQRRRVFVRSVGDSVQLTDRGELLVTLPIHEAADYGPILASHRIKLRPRALITTMYARLVLSDLFIHGIGGAKYDELTDLIIRRFFGVEPPAYVTATATFRLPIDRPTVSFDDVRASARHIRELRYRPESFLRDPRVSQDVELLPKLAALAAEKREFLDQHDLRRCSPDVFDRLNLLNLAMNDLLTPMERQLRAEHADLIAQARQSQLLGSREFSFVLFPSEILPARLLDLCKNVS